MCLSSPYTEASVDNKPDFRHNDHLVSLPHNRTDRTSEPKIREMHFLQLHLCWEDFQYLNGIQGVPCRGNQDTHVSFVFVQYERRSVQKTIDYWKKKT